MENYKTFETERLLIRLTSVEDALFIFELLNTPKWHKYIGDRQVNTIDDAKTYIVNKMMPQLKRLGFGNNTVIRKSDNTKIGTCGLYDREGIDGVDIGFAFLPEYEKKGYAFESAIKVIEIAFKEFDLKQINAITDQKNSSSQKLLRRLGFESNGTTILPGEEMELLLYKKIS